MGWLGVTLVTVIMKCCLLYSEQCCRLPGTLPLVVQILLLVVAVMYWRYRVGARECGFAILVRVSRVVRVLVHVLVRESERVLARTTKGLRVLVHVLVQYEVSLEKFYLRCTLTCHWCVRVKCSGASDAVARDYKKDWKVRGANKKGYYVCLRN